MIKGLGWKVALPIVIGFGVIAWLFHDDFSEAAFASIHFGWRAVVGIALACLFVVGRDFGLTWRFHTIAAPDLSWKRALRVDLMCAFTSAITPSAVGGSALAIFYLNTEGVKVGRATALTLTTLFLDELFFVIFCPIIVLCLPLDQLFGSGERSGFLQGVEIVFWLVYAGIVIWTSILYAGILWKPQIVQKVFVKLFSMKWLRRWLPNVQQMTGNMIATSDWVKHCPRSWWLNVFGATVLSWFSRYLIVNAIFWAFIPGCNWGLVFCRQFVVWVVLMVSPTPGSSGLSEWMFTEYYGDLIGNLDLALVMALIWRLITYYIYLALGVCLAPTYFKKSKVNDNKFKNNND
ncbi:MAG: flippase-like domain-containing protein [Bacteroidales bacterium]|nr:flippase-like domain-containing protein [Bacteroidales bacterium]